jgi:hypothetical protein
MSSIKATSSASSQKIMLTTFIVFCLTIGHLSPNFADAPVLKLYLISSVLIPKKLTSRPNTIDHAPVCPQLFSPVSQSDAYSGQMGTKYLVS